jgi:hypothetical protein
MSGISNMVRDYGVNPAIVRIYTGDDLTVITTTGYFLGTQSANLQAINAGPWEWAYDANGNITDLCLIFYATDQIGFFTYDVATDSFVSLADNGNLSYTLPNGDIFVGNASNIATGVAVTGVVAITNTGVTSLVAPIAISDTTSSATPGTIRSFFSTMNGTATTMTSGNLVGVRGEVAYVSASGGFLYGVQGKIIPTGTLSGSSWNAGVFGQLDISGATINAGQVAPIWGDYGSASGTLTNQTGLYGIAMTNTTAAVLEGQLYLYGGATNLMLLNTNAGLSGTTYFKAAGTSSGSAGYASGCNATEVLQISVNGTTYYLPCFAQNS